jgi:hypothetical protein
MRRLVAFFFLFWFDTNFQDAGRYIYAG